MVLLDESAYWGRCLCRNRISAQVGKEAQPEGLLQRARHAPGPPWDVLLHPLDGLPHLGVGIRRLGLRLGQLATHRPLRGIWGYGYCIWRRPSNDA